MSEDTTVYYIQIDFVGGVEVDGKFISDPPNVFICSEEGMILEVLEEPIFIGGDSTDRDEDWEPGPIAKRILALLNGNDTK